MYGAIVLIAVLITTTLLPFSGVTHRTSWRGIVKPQIVENGTDSVLFPFSLGIAGNTEFSKVAFTPNGDAYFVSDVGNVVRLSPDGTYAQFSIPQAYFSIVYAHGKLWTTAANGVISFAPDGTQRRFFGLRTHKGSLFESITVGPDGGVYVTESVGSFPAGVSGLIFRIDADGNVTSRAIPTDPNGEAATFGSDGRLYFGYEGNPNGLGGIARLEADGTTTLFPLPHDFPDSMVASRGSLYFDSFTQQGFLGRLTTGGVVSEIALPGGSGTQINNLSVDKGGNIWTSLTPLAAGVALLYQYNVYTGHFSGPYSPSGINKIIVGPAVGPDDNAWVVVATQTPPAKLFGAYVRHVQTLEPANVSLGSAQPASFTILETNFNGPWTAQSLSPSVATVMPASSSTGDFTVRETGPGLTSIAVKDRLGNIIYEPVTAY